MLRSHTACPAGGLELRADSFFPTLPLLSALFTRASAAEPGTSLFSRTPAAETGASLFSRTPTVEAATGGLFRASAVEASARGASERSWSGDGDDLAAPLEPFEEEAGSEARPCD